MATRSSPSTASPTRSRDPLPPGAETGHGSGVTDPDTSPPGPIRLLVSDVDGTLVTDEKRLTERAVAAIAALRAAGVRFTIVSSRPPRGLQPFVARLGLDTPFGGFNGGAVAEPKGATIMALKAPPEPVARHVLAHLEARGVSAWVFDGDDWIIRDPQGPHVDHERRTIGYEPRIVPSFDTLALARVGKIVGASDDHDLLARCEAELGTMLGATASALRSQSYYLDVTHPEATKGGFVRDLSRRLSVPPAEIAVMGDMMNDVSMFGEAGLAIAMGNASEAVKAAAGRVAASNEDEGFARAVEDLILPRGPGLSGYPRSSS